MIVKHDGSDTFPAFDVEHAATFPRINDGRHVHAMGPQVLSGSVTRTVVREDHNGFPGGNRIAIGIVSHGGSGHDARNIIAAEHDGPFFRACRQHGPLCKDAPIALARLIVAGCHHMVGHPFHRAKHVAIKPAKDRGARHQCHIGHGGQFSDHAPRPVEA